MEKCNEKNGNLAGQIAGLKKSEELCQTDKEKCFQDGKIDDADIKRLETALAEKEKETVECKANLESSNKNLKQLETTNTQLSASLDDTEKKANMLSGEVAVLESKLETVQQAKERCDKTLTNRDEVLKTHHKTISELISTKVNSITDDFKKMEAAFADSATSIEEETLSFQSELLTAWGKLKDAYFKSASVPTEGESQTSHSNEQPSEEPKPEEPKTE